MNDFWALKPSALYRRWEKQHWSAHTIDLTADRREWLAKTDEARWQWYWLAGFSHYRQFEANGVVSLTALMGVLPNADQQRFLSTQIADEGRHSYFFERFHDEVLSSAIPAGEASISPAYQQLAVDQLRDIALRAARQPSHANLARAALHIFVVMEGSYALAGFWSIRLILSKMQQFPGLREGMGFVHRDEIRHAQFGLSLLHSVFMADPSARGAAAEYMTELLPLFSKVLEPRPARMAILESVGINPLGRRQKAFLFLQRHLTALDLPIDVTAAARWPRESHEL